MSMDSSNFPYVWMSFAQSPDHDPVRDFEELEANLKRGEPFVLLSDSVPAEDHEHSPEEKKRTSLWMKENKAELHKLVLAMIVIEPSAAKRLAFAAFSMLFAKFWGYPLMLASSREEGMEIAGKLLAEHAGSTAA